MRGPVSTVERLGRPSQDPGVLRTPNVIGRRLTIIAADTFARGIECRSP